MTSCNVNFTHYSLSLVFFICSLFFISLLLYFINDSLFSSILLLSHSLIDSPWVYSFSLNLSFNSLIFGAIVSLITSVVLVFALAYMGLSYNYVEFLTLLCLFVVSMLMVIFLNDLFTVMLGWDGLGIISFFLIVYYQSPNTVFSGWFTLLINRVGDALLILTIVFMWYFDPLSGLFLNMASGAPLSLTLLLLFGLITKSAIFPFSPWLPVAISAPTPISSLVHSSTLVTAGLYLIIRLESLILVSWDVSIILLTLSVFTSLYAGVGSIVESDLKKLVALSTLSHLGFIGIALSLGSTSLAFFHLLVHALFKSLLFIGVGDWIVVGHHYQDARQLSSGLSLTPFSSFIVVSSNLSLLGFPFMSGYYSNDYILEFISYSYVCVFLTVVIYLNVILTFLYTLRVIRYVLTESSISSPYFLVNSYNFLHYPSLSLLSLTSFIFPTLYSYSPMTYSLCSPSFLHYLPFIILLVTLFMFYHVYLKFSLSFPAPSLLLNQMFSNMIFTFSLYSNGLGLLWANSLPPILLTLEQGVLTGSLISLPGEFFSSSVSYFSRFSGNTLTVILWAVLTLTFLYIMS